MRCDRTGFSSNLLFDSFAAAALSAEIAAAIAAALVNLPTSEYASFFAIMPPDNPATIALNGKLQLPRNGDASPPLSITRLTADTFQLLSGSYSINWQTSITEAGQLELQVNGAPNLTTVMGRATGTSEIVQTVTLNVPVTSTISIINPPGNAAALTVTPLAGGATPVTAWLNIRRLK
jgi:hypothetical protein